MKIAYLDCFSGISGDMTLGALLHAGLEKDALLAELHHLNLSGYRFEVESSRRGTLAGTKVNVIIERKQPARSLREILSLIEESGLSNTIKEKATRIFQHLGAAEAQVHGVTPSTVHLHEVGAADAIVDIVGVVAGMELLGIEHLVASPVNVGKGTVETEHGTLPVPAPATLALLKGKPTYSKGAAMELTTPTGAAILAGLVHKFGDQPPMQVASIGYGLGHADPPGWPNCLRIMIGEESTDTQDYCWMIESNIDDMNPEIYDFVMEKLLSKGALDVFLTPILMKKGRPATRISVLSPRDKEETLVKILFHETTAIGLRRYRVEREKLRRRIVHVATPYGEVPVKLAFFQGDVVNLSPEYEACRKLSREKGVPLKEIYHEALRAAKENSE